ncbi:hypothetical protein [Maridesulfovibrio ferrireducens]|uniref:hypothetical protein n=1 Tax=Maridesulfovibrio ferrireducens TaxID=246191 RepID=UPI0026EBBCD5|nr:hypothetical protein [Maridesulfovibrio ferrireducens]
MKVKTSLIVDLTPVTWVRRELPSRHPYGLRETTNAGHCVQMGAGVLLYLPGSQSLTATNEDRMKLAFTTMVSIMMLSELLILGPMIGAVMGGLR